MKPAAIVLLLLALVLTASFVAGQESFIKHVGAVVRDGNGFYEVGGVAQINQSPYRIVSGEWAYVNFSTILSTQRDVTVMFQGIQITGFQRLTGWVLDSETVATRTPAFYPNGTGYTTVTYSVVPVQRSVWSDVALNSFKFDGSTLQGRTVHNFGSQLNDQYRIKGKCPGDESIFRTATCEYSILLNGTYGGQMHVVDFDPSLESSLVAYWDGSGSGSTLTDIYGSNDMAVYGSANFNSSSPKNGQFITINGKGVALTDFLTVQSAPLNINGTNDFSIAFWMRMHQDSPTSSYLMTHSSEAGGHPFTLVCGGTDEGQFRSVTKNFCDANTAPQGDGWQLYVFVVNNTGQVNYTTYMNQTKSNSGGSSLIPLASRINLTIGCGAVVLSGCAGFTYLNADIGHISVWNRALDQSDVNSLWNGGSGTFCSGDPCSFIGGAGSSPELQIQASDFYDSGTVFNFSVKVYNATATFTNSTTTGTVKFGGTLANLTSYTVNFSSNYSGGYFNESTTLTVTGISLTHTFRPYQAYVTFNASEAFTAFQITTGLNGSTVGVANQSSTGTLAFRLKSNVTGYVFNFSSPNYLNTTLTINAPAALSNSTVQVSFGNILVNVTAYDTVTNQTVTSGYTLTAQPVNLSRNATATTSNALLTHMVLLKGYVYNLTANFTNGNPETTSKAFTLTANANLSIYAQTVHSFNLNILNEQTKTLINNQTVNVEFIGPSSVNVSTGNGTLFAGNLTPGEYEVKYSAVTFFQRSYYFTLPLGGSGSVNLYLLDNTNGTEVPMSVKNQNFDGIESATIEALRFYTQSNAYEVVEVVKTSFDGTTAMHLKLLGPNYKFRISTGGAVRFNSIGSTLTTAQSVNGLNFQVNTESNPLTLVQGLKNVQANVSHVPSIGAFAFSFVDSSNEFNQACLEVSFTGKSGSGIVNSSCSSSESGTIILAFSNATQGTYTGVGYLVADGGYGTTVKLRVDEKSTFSDVESVVKSLGSLGLFLVVLMILGISMTFLYDPRAAVIAAAIAFAIPVFAGITVFSMSAVLAVIGAAFIAAAIMRPRDKS